MLVGGAAWTYWAQPLADPAWVTDSALGPAPGLVAYLLARLGGLFFPLAATAPLLQRWFSRTTHRRAADPYFLYAASNAGSLVGLVAYPLAVERLLPLSEQARLLFAGFLATAAGVGLAMLSTARRLAPVVESAAESGGRVPPWRWLALSALPASLLGGVTLHLTTDVAPVPLLWVLPLGLYLASFVVVFSRWSGRAAFVASRILPAGLVFVAITLAGRAARPMEALVALHLAAFFVACLVCHGELARSRPPASGLTRFYLILALGGVLGGGLTAWLAPVVFARVGPAEYPLALVLVALVRPGRETAWPSESWKFTRADAAWVAAFAALVAVLVLAVGPRWPVSTRDEDLPALVGRSALLFGLPGALCFALVARPLRFALCLGAYLALGRFDPGPHGRTLHLARNFYGTVEVTQSVDGEFVRLVHGTTQHGQMRRDEPGPPTPLGYYYPTGPAGRLLGAAPPGKSVGVVGLGVGALAAYAKPGDRLTFYEIDPAVTDIARNPEYFRYLSECAAPVAVVAGDARRELARSPERYDWLILDAFSSDAVPVHLLTVEAFTLYRERLNPGGVIVCHLSNRYLDLAPAVRASATAANPAWHCFLDHDLAKDSERPLGKWDSTWLAVAESRAQLGPGGGLQFQEMRGAGVAAWRDDFADLLSAWRRGDD